MALLVTVETPALTGKSNAIAAEMAMGVLLLCQSLPGLSRRGD